MIFSIAWPHLVPQFPTDPAATEKLVADLYSTSQELKDQTSHLIHVHKQIENSCRGTAIISQQQKLHSLISASQKLSDNLQAASQAAQKYADILRIQLTQQTILKAHHNALALRAVDLASVISPFIEPVKFLSYQNDLVHYNINLKDYLYECHSAEDAFIDALGLQKFPNPQTGEYAGIITAAQRDTINRRKLIQDISALQQLPFLNALQRRALQNAQEIQRQIIYIDHTLHPGVTQLYSYDLTAFQGDGKVLIGIGDLDHAHNIAVSIPGITSQVSSVHTTVDDILHLYFGVHQKNPTADFAGLVCLGYDAPSGHDILSETITPDKARAGALAIAQEIDEFAAMRHYVGNGQNPDPQQDKLHLTLIGHSYGSTTTAYAGLNGRLADQIDDVILIGSPGTGPMQHATEFGLGATHVHIGKDPADLVASIASNAQGHSNNDFNYLHYLGNISQIFGLGLGNDPYDPQFHGNPFSADNTEKLLLHKFIGAHLGYYQPGSTSLDNIINIVSTDKPPEPIKPIEDKPPEPLEPKSK